MTKHNDAQTKEVENLDSFSVIKPEFVRKECTGNVFFNPETDVFEGEAKADARMYKLRLNEETCELVFTAGNGDDIGIVLQQHSKAGETNTNGNAYPHWESAGLLTLEKQPYTLVAWEGQTQKGNAMLSISLSEYTPMRSFKGKFGSFVDSEHSDTRESVRDTQDDTQNAFSHALNG